MGNLDYLVQYDTVSCCYETYEIVGDKFLKDKKYHQIQFYRSRYDRANLSFEIPNSCYYLYSYPNSIYEKTYLGIREEDGRWLVDKEEYIGLISDTCWWKYVGEASYIPYEETADGELVLYGFTEKVGDIYAAAERHEPIMVVDEELVENRDGSQCRMFVLSNGCKIVEGIGCINSPGLLLFYLNPHKTVLNFGSLTHCWCGSKSFFYQNFMASAEEAVSKYERQSVQLSCPDDQHPHAIDLGLPSGLKWSCCNVGASSPKEVGSYFAWGETEEKSVYNYSNYTYHTHSMEYDFSKTTEEISGSKYDAASAKWSEPWRIATVEETEELIYHCLMETVNNRQAYGLRLTGPNGQSIYFPFNYPKYHSGNYWTGNVYPFQNEFANTVYINRNPDGYIYIASPYSGLPVRPIYGGTSAIANALQNAQHLSGPVFNAYGMKVGEAPEVLSHLPAGIYVVGGKKIVVRRQ